MTSLTLSCMLSATRWWEKKKKFVRNECTSSQFDGNEKNCVYRFLNVQHVHTSRMYTCFEPPPPSLPSCNDIYSSTLEM